MRKQLTGEPVAGKLHTGFGGRGRRSPFPTPIHRSLKDIRDLFVGGVRYGCQKKCEADPEASEPAGEAGD